MRFRKVLIVALVAIMLLTLTGCSPANFMSNNQRDKLVKAYGTPTMEVVLEYTHNDKTYTLKLEYELLLEHAPITVVNFINLVGKEHYNSTTEDGAVTSMIFDNRINSSSTNAWVAGRYTATVNGDSTVYNYTKDLGYTIKGEFVSNDYQLDIREEDKDDDDIKDGNAKFKLFSLAMYHGSTGSEFDAASGAFFLTTSSHTTENYKNYAVFAYLKDMKVELDGEQIASGMGATASVIDDINNHMTSTESKDVVSVDVEGDTDSIRMLTNLFRIVSIAMTDDNDYSKLPTNYIIK